MLITSSIATGLSSYILPRSILTEKIARRGLHLTREYHTDPLQMCYCKDIAWRPEPFIQADTTIEGIGEQMLAQYDAETWLRVVDESGGLKGIIRAWDIVRHSRLSPHARVGELMNRSPIVNPTDTAKTALLRMVGDNADWVCIQDEQGQVFGFVTVRQLLELRKREYAEESIRERVFIMPSLPVQDVSQTESENVVHL